MYKLMVTDNKIETHRISHTISQNLKKFNESKVGPYEFEPIVVSIVDDSGTIIGGVKADILDKVCMIQTAWIHESERKKGLGTKLFKKLEEFAKKKNCKILQLDTSEFQAKGFYEKIGFSVVATLPENFKGYTTYIMRKMI